MSIVSLPSHYAVSASSPDNAIHLYDKARLANVHALAGHESAITTLRSVPIFAGTASQTLISCGRDGVVKAWDERSPSGGVKSEHKSRTGPYSVAELNTSLQHPL